MSNRIEDGMRRRSYVARCAITLALVACAQGAAADDWMEVGQSGREVWVVDGASGRRSTVRLGLKEVVVAEAAAGRVAVIATSDRLLGISAGGSWSEVRWGSQESLPEVVLASERVGLVITNRRILGFAGGASLWAEERTGPRESIQDFALGESVVVAVMGDQVLGLSARRAAFSAVPLGAREVVQSIGASDLSGTVQTDRLLHTFSAIRGWSSTRVRH